MRLEDARGPALIGVANSVSDDRGTYRFPALPPGRYEVTAQLAGFAPARVEDIAVALGKNLRVDLTMKVATQAEEVTVVGEAPVIDTKSSASFKNLSREFFDAIPKGRDFTSIVNLAPGANFEEKAGGIAVDGASGAENSYILDGIDTTNLQTGVRAKRVVFDVIEEVQVKSSGYPAEYGGAIGGVINVITRSGANNFFGEAGVYFNSDALNGTPRDFLRLGLVDSSKSEYIPTSDDCDTTKGTYSMNLDYVASNKLYFNLRAGYFSYDLTELGIPTDVWHQFIESNEAPTANGILTAAEVASIPANLKFSRNYPLPHLDHQRAVLRRVQRRRRGRGRDARPAS